MPATNKNRTVSQTYLFSGLHPLPPYTRPKAPPPPPIWLITVPVSLDINKRLRLSRSRFQSRPDLGSPGSTPPPPPPPPGSPVTTGAPSPRLSRAQVSRATTHARTCSVSNELYPAPPLPHAPPPRTVFATHHAQPPHPPASEILPLPPPRPPAPPASSGPTSHKPSRATAPAHPCLSPYLINPPCRPMAPAISCRERVCVLIWSIFTCLLVFGLLFRSFSLFLVYLAGWSCSQIGHKLHRPPPLTTTTSSSDTLPRHHRARAATKPSPRGAATATEPHQMAAQAAFSLSGPHGTQDTWPGPPSPDQPDGFTCCAVCLSNGGIIGTIAHLPDSLFKSFSTHPPTPPSPASPTLPLPGHLPLAPSPSPAQGDVSHTRPAHLKPLRRLLAHPKAPAATSPNSHHASALPRRRLPSSRATTKDEPAGLLRRSHQAHQQ